MKKFSKTDVKRILRVPLRMLALPLSLVVPRSSRQWAFGNSGPFFAGNSKYLFLWMSSNCPEHKVTWLSNSGITVRHLKKNGYDAYLRWSPHGIWRALRAGVFVSCNSFDDVNFVLSSNVFRLNLWHGVGLKSLDKHPQAVVQAVEHKKSAGRFVRWVTRLFEPPRPDVFVTTSELMQAHFSRVFGLSVARCPQLGYSRLDCAVDSDLVRSAEKLDQATGFQFNPNEVDEIYLYAPTHRDSVRPFFSDAIPDAARLSKILSERNALLYIKPHPGTSDPVPNSARIHRWPENVDVHPYLGKLTGLITDYSSVLYDYLYLGTGASILYTFDFDQYREMDRSLRYDYKENTVGLRINTFDELCEALQDGSAAEPPPEVDTILERFWGGSSVPASPAIVAYVMNRVRS